MPIASHNTLPYHSSCKFKQEYGRHHVYDIQEEPSLDETELNSIQLMEIVTNYAIPRECTRELVYFIQTLITNNLKDAELKNGKPKEKIESKQKLIIDS